MSQRLIVRPLSPIVAAYARIASLLLAKFKHRGSHRHVQDILTYMSLYILQFVHKYRPPS